MNQNEITILRVGEEYLLPAEKGGWVKRKVAETGVLITLGPVDRAHGATVLTIADLDWIYEVLKPKRKGNKK